MGDLSRESVAEAIRAQAGPPADSPAKIVVGEKSNFLQNAFKSAVDFYQGAKALGQELGERLDAVADRKNSGYAGLAEKTNDQLDRVERTMAAPPSPGFNP